MTNTSRTAAELTATRRLNKLTSMATAWDRWADLVTACERGHVPSLRRDDLIQDLLGESLEQVGLKVFWG